MTLTDMVLAADRQLERTVGGRTERLDRVSDDVVRTLADAGVDLTHDEVARLGEEIDPRYQALLLVAAYCGLRAGELIALRRSNVDLAHRTITVVEQVQCLHGRFEVLPPKTAAGRRAAALPGIVADALELHLPG